MVLPAADSSILWTPRRARQRAVCLCSPSLGPAPVRRLVPPVTREKKAANGPFQLQTGRSSEGRADLSVKWGLLFNGSTRLTCLHTAGQVPVVALPDLSERPADGLVPALAWEPPSPRRGGPDLLTRVPSTWSPRPGGNQSSGICKTARAAHARHLLIRKSLPRPGSL